MVKAIRLGTPGGRHRHAHAGATTAGHSNTSSTSNHELSKSFRIYTHIYTSICIHSRTYDRFITSTGNMGPNRWTTEALTTLHIRNLTDMPRTFCRLAKHCF